MFKLGCFQVTVLLSSNVWCRWVADRCCLWGLCGKRRVTQSDGYWRAVGGSRKLGGQMRLVSTDFPLCLSQLYIAVGVSAACLSVRSSKARHRKMCVSVRVGRKMLLRRMDFFNPVRSWLLFRDPKVDVKHISSTETLAYWPDGNDHTGTASLHCAPSCVCPGGNAGWTACHTRHKQMAFLLHITTGEPYINRHQDYQSILLDAKHLTFFKCNTMWFIMLICDYNLFCFFESKPKEQQKEQESGKGKIHTRHQDELKIFNISTKTNNYKLKQLYTLNLLHKL